MTAMHCPVVTLPPGATEPEPGHTPPALVADGKGSLLVLDNTQVLHQVGCTRIKGVGWMGREDMSGMYPPLRYVRKLRRA